MTALGAVSAVIAGAVAIDAHMGWTEPANLYLMPIAAPGEGKTPAFAEIVRPLHRI
jgi:hypothetical protein